jgi:hypothetical protein
MAFTDIIPEVWAARLLANLDKNMVYGNAINRDYQADAEYGNVVHVDKMGAVTIGDYTQNTTIGTPQILASTQTDITINQQKFYNFFIDSIDEAQAKPALMDAAMGRAAYAMANTVDAYLAGFYASAGNAIGVVGTPVTPTAANIYTYLTQAHQKLDEENVPTVGRYVIMNPAGIKLLKDSGEFLSDTAMGDVLRRDGGLGGSQMQPNGYMGRAANFDVWMSNNTASSGASTSIWQFGHPMGVSMVDSVNEVIGYQPETLFGDAVKGLYVYGAAMLQPDAVVAMYTTL